MPRQPARASSGRYVSRLTGGALAVIMAGGRGERLKALTEHRCKPATPFGGKFRIIDFVLSNCVNSGIRQISILTQYKAQSLIQHVERGWSFLRGEFGEFVEVIPAQQQIGEQWYRGTADAVYQNLDLLLSHRPKHVLVLAGAPPAAPPDDDTVRAAVAALVADGASTRDAAAEVAATLGVPRRRAYDIATALRHP